MALVMPEDFNYNDFRAQVAISYVAGANYLALGDTLDENGVSGFEYFAAIPNQDVEPNYKFALYTFDNFERFNIAMHIEQMPDQYIAMKTWVLSVNWGSFIGFFDTEYHFTLLHALMQSEGFKGSLTEQELAEIETIFNIAQNRYTYMYYFTKLCTNDADKLEENQTFMQNLIQSCYNNENYDDERTAYFKDIDLFLKPTEFALGQTCKDKLLEIQSA